MLNTEGGAGASTASASASACASAAGVARVDAAAIVDAAAAEAAEKAARASYLLQRLEPAGSSAVGAVPASSARRRSSTPPHLAFDAAAEEESKPKAKTQCKMDVEGATMEDVLLDDRVDSNGQLLFFRSCDSNKKLVMIRIIFNLDHMIGIIFKSDHMIGSNSC